MCNRLMIANEKKFEDVESGLIREVYEYWDRKRGSRSMPSRSDLDPIEIPALLPHILLVDVTPPDSRLKFRLAGTNVVEKFGEDYTGKFMDEVYFGDVQEKILFEYNYVAAEKRVIVCDHKFRRLTDYTYDIERIIMPLSDNGEDVNMLFALLAFEQN